MVANRTAVNQSAAGSTTPEGSAARRTTRKTTDQTPKKPKKTPERTQKKATRKTARKTTDETTGRPTRKPAGEPAGAGTSDGRAEQERPSTDAAASRPKKKAARKKTARQTGAKKVAGKKSTTNESAAAVPPARAAAPAAPGDLAVRAGEEPWTAEEVAEARAELSDEAERLRAEITAAEKALSGLMRDSGDGAGDDQADTGTKNVTREHELALTGNAREVLYQTERALERLAAGTYGRCENCGNPIGKARMQAFPRATLCVDCKQRQERRW